MSLRFIVSPIYEGRPPSTDGPRWLAGDKAAALRHNGRKGISTLVSIVRGPSLLFLTPTAKLVYPFSPASPRYCPGQL